MFLEKVNSPDDLKELPEESLVRLADEIREFLIENVTRTGGHLSPNLGVVELTIALHRVFKSPQDSIIWDVGHQAYVHKMLTGRKKDFLKLRQAGGLSGYPNPAESEHDVIHAGHSSTSLSIASGIAQAKVLKGDKSATVAIIGDGSFTAGMVYEALNTLSHQRLPMIIVLNDNGMSISENVGGISLYFNHLRTSKPYMTFKRRFEFFLNRLPGGNPMKKLFYNIKESVKETVIEGRFFHDMGINYYGPYNGHNIPDMIDLFEQFKNTDRPVLLHVVTQKGRGYSPSEDDPSGYHGISGISVNGDGSIPIKEGKSYSKIFGETLTELAEKDPKIVAVSAAMETGTGLSAFSKRFPDRFFDVGIAEQHAVDFGLGLSLQGYKPVVAIYSTFLQRGYDQLVHDIGIAGGKVLFCLDRAGLVPNDGETHQGVFDISYLRMIPGMSIMLPATATEFKLMLKKALENLNGPMAIRYPKDLAVDLKDYPVENLPFEFGEGITVKEGKDALIVSTGTHLKIALEAARKLEKEGVHVEVFNLRFAKPVGEKTLEHLSKGKRPTIIIEEGVENGGVSCYIHRVMKNENGGRNVEIIALPDEFPTVDIRENLLKKYGFSSDNLIKKLKKTLNK